MAVMLRRLPALAGLAPYQRRMTRSTLRGPSNSITHLWLPKPNWQFCSASRSHPAVLNRAPTRSASIALTVAFRRRSLTVAMTGR